MLGGGKLSKSFLILARGGRNMAGKFKHRGKTRKKPEEENRSKDEKIEGKKSGNLKVLARSSLAQIHSEYGSTGGKNLENEDYCNFQEKWVYQGQEPKIIF